MSKCQQSSNSYPVYTTLISGVNIPPNQGFRPQVQQVIMKVLETQARPETPPGTFKSQLVQTLFRESEVQTEPFVPDVKEPVNKSLEILTLGWLSLNNGLPAGMREVVIIERARQRRAWEKALPTPFNKVTQAIRTMILEAIEFNEWTFREAELSAISSLRMELAEKCMSENLAANRVKYENRLFRYIAQRNEKKEMSLQKIRFQLKRNIRKLMYKRDKVNHKFYRWNIINELGNKTSEFYAPIQRFGVDPRRAHEVIPCEYRYWNVFSSMEVLYLDSELLERKRKTTQFDYIKKSKPTKTYKQLCIRETRWTEAYLDKLHSLLKAIRIHGRKGEKQACKLKKRIPAPPPPFKTPAVKGISDEEETLFQACLYLQKTIKGRAIQTVMFEGRVRCQELIEELKSTHALQDHVDDIKAQSRKKMYQMQRKAEIEAIERRRRDEILHSLEGKTVSEILDFLSKELLRLQNERITHAYALMADQERHKREAKEAGRRQAEEQRRREHDEMGRQLCKIYQNNLDMIEDNFSSVFMNIYAAREGRMMAEDYAKKIDIAAHEANLYINELQDQEIIADLVHNFALPEAEKVMVRKRLKDRQRMTLATCHDEIYSQIEKIVQLPRSESGTLEPLPRPPKHRVPPTFHVKFLKLSRMGGSKGSSEGSTGSGQMTPVDHDWQRLQERSGFVNSRNSSVNNNSEIWSTGFSRQEVVFD